MKLLKRCGCKCLHRPGQPNQTSCRTCSSMKVNVRIWNRQRREWHRNAEEQKAKAAPDGTIQAAVNPCTACNGTCPSGGLHREMTGSADLLPDSVLCSVVRQPHLELPRIDENDMVRPGEGKAFAHAPHKCHLARCGDCGLDNKFPTVNGGRWQGPGAVRVRFCPIEWPEVGIVNWHV